MLKTKYYPLVDGKIDANNFQVVDERTLTDDKCVLSLNSLIVSLQLLSLNGVCMYLGQRLSPITILLITFTIWLTISSVAASTLELSRESCSQ